MFDKLLALLTEFWDYFKPFEIVYAYEEGVLYRLGRDKKVLKPGFHWKWFIIDYVIKDMVVTQTLTIPCQTVISKDLKEITIKAVVKYNIEDIRLFQTRVYDRVDALSDTTMIINKELVTQTDSKKIQFIDNELAKKLRVQVKKWGISIENVSLTDISETNSFRLFNENVKND